MKFLVTGMNGQLGHDVMKTLAARGHDCTGCGSSGAYHGLADEAAAMRYRQLDITDGDAVQRLLNALRPDAVVHCAAWTNVESAQLPAQLTAVRAVNTQGTEHLARACRSLDCRLLYVSTEYVFGGSGSRPHTAADTAFDPLNVYGQTKRAGEIAVQRTLEKHFIVRTSWLYGANGGNFVKSILDAGKKNGTVQVVNDQFGRPTYSLDLARLLADMIETEKYGVYHASNEGSFISWYDFACEIYRQAGMQVQVLPVTASAYSRAKAPRPSNSRLDTGCLAENGFIPLPRWEDALRRFLHSQGYRSASEA